MGNTVFGSNVIGNFTTTGGSTSSPTITAINTVPLPQGYFLSWVVATPTSISNAANHTYVKNALSYAGAGESIRIASIEFYKGNFPVMPIITPGISNVVRAADVVYFDGISTSAYTLGAGFATNAMRNPTGYRLFLGTAANHLAVLSNGSNLILRTVVASTVVEELLGPPPSDFDQIAITYSSVTGNKRWAVNGIFQTSGSIPGPTGLTRVYIGSHADGTGQINGKATWFGLGYGIWGALDEATAGEATSGESTGITVYDRSEIVMLPDGVSNMKFLVPLMGGANNDYDSYLVNLRDNAAQSAYGYATDANWHVKRTGEFSFTNIRQTTDDNGASDDSAFALAVQDEFGNWVNLNINAGAFNAIVAGTTNHGFCKQKWAQFLADGAVVSPVGFTPRSAKTGTFMQLVEYYIPTPNSFQTDGSHTLPVHADIVFMERFLRIDYNHLGAWAQVWWRCVRNVKMKSSSYLRMMSTNEEMYDTAIVLEGTADIRDGTFTALDTDFASMTVRDTGVFERTTKCLTGFKYKTSRGRIQDNNNSATGKAYWMLDRADFFMNAGDVIEATFHETARLLS